MISIGDATVLILTITALMGLAGLWYLMLKSFNTDDTNRAMREAIRRRIREKEAEIAELERHIQELRGQ